MKVLFTGRGTSGSWQIRGIQVAKAMGARAVSLASSAECKTVDVVIAVKRVPNDLLENIRRSGRPFVWDVVDAYPQPQCGAWSEVQAKDWLRKELERIRPNAVIWPTKRMQADADSRIQGRVINHHHRPGIELNPIRGEIRTVGYEGDVSYLGEWAEVLRRECKRIGAEFVLNPPRLADLDVVVALRGSAFNGYAQRMWKSNVKAANAQGSGTPLICNVSASYWDTADEGVQWVTHPEEIGRTMDELAPQRVRQEASALGYAARYSVDDAANDYREFLCALKF